MSKYYFFIILLGIIVAVVIIIAFTIAGNPLDRQAIVSDNNKIRDFTSIKAMIDNYYSLNKKLPDDLESIASNNNPLNPINKGYDYNILTSTTYELCTEFSTDTTDTTKQTGRGMIAPPNDTYYTGSTAHKKGYDCIKYQVYQYQINPTPSSRPPSPTPSPRLTHQYIENGSFEAWTNPLPDYWSLDIGSQVNRISQSYEGNNAIQFPAKRPKSTLMYEKISVQPNKKYRLGFYYKTESACKDCAFAGFQIFDKSGGEIISDVYNCGEYNSEEGMWYQYIQGITSNYTFQEKECSMPGNAASVRVKVGTWNPSDAEWAFDKFALN